MTYTKAIIPQKQGAEASCKLLRSGPCGLATYTPILPHFLLWYNLRRLLGVQLVQRGLRFGLEFVQESLQKCIN